MYYRVLSWFWLEETCPALIQAAARIDLARAKLFLGEDMEGEVGCSRLTCSPGFSEIQQTSGRCPMLEMMGS